MNANCCTCSTLALIAGVARSQVNKFKLQAKASFQFIVDFLRKQLRCKPTDPLVRSSSYALFKSRS